MLGVLVLCEYEADVVVSCSLTTGSRSLIEDEFLRFKKMLSSFKIHSIQGLFS